MSASFSRNFFNWGKITSTVPVNALTPKPPDQHLWSTNKETVTGTSHSTGEAEETDL